MVPCAAKSVFSLGSGCDAVGLVRGGLDCRAHEVPNAVMILNEEDSRHNRPSPCMTVPRGFRTSQTGLPGDKGDLLIEIGKKGSFHIAPTARVMETRFSRSLVPPARLDALPLCRPTTWTRGGTVLSMITVIPAARCIRHRTGRSCRRAARSRPASPTRQAAARPDRSARAASRAGSGRRARTCGNDRGQPFGQIRDEIGAGAGHVSAVSFFSRARRALGKQPLPGKPDPTRKGSPSPQLRMVRRPLQRRTPTRQ